MKTLNRRVPSSNPFRTLFSYRGFLISPVSMDRMKRGWPYIAVFMLYLALTISAAAQDNRGILVSSERLALVIGNNAYQSAPLRNPVNDAEDMSSVLVGLGFNVTLKKDADRRTLEDSIRQFGRQLRNGGVGLFYFAGHGMQVEGRNYLIPTHARIESESETLGIENIPFGGTILGTAVKQLKAAGNDYKMDMMYLPRTMAEQNMGEYNITLAAKQMANMEVYRNHNECFTMWGRCQYYDVCHAGIDLSGPPYIDLENRYKDL